MAATTACATWSAETFPDFTAFRSMASRARVCSDFVEAANSLGRLRSESTMPVGTYAGHSTETPTFELRSRRSWCSDSDSATTACLVTLYAPEPGGEMRPDTDAVLTMCPSSCAMRCGVKARTPCTTPHRLTPRIHCQSAALFSHTAPSGDTPALLHTTCTPPSRVSVWSRKISTCCALETSTLSVIVRTPFASTSSCTEERLTSSTSASARSMPSAAKASAMERPRPLAAPVTAATFPLSSFIASAQSVPQHGGAAEQNQNLHEEDMQPGAHARDQPCRDRTARDAGEADHRAGEEGVGVQQVEAIEQRRLAHVEDDRDHRVGGEHRRRREPGAEQQRN